MSETQFLSVDRLLKSVGLGVTPMQPPASVGGVGGRCKVTLAAAIPIALGGTPGILHTLICPGQVPTLVPVTLLRKLRAVVDLPSMVVRWEGSSKVSSLEETHTGHLAVNIMEGIEQFLHVVPKAESFRRKKAHDLATEKLLQDMRTRAYAEPEGRKKKVEFFDMQDLDASVAAGSVIALEGQLERCSGLLPQPDGNSPAECCAAGLSTSKKCRSILRRRGDPSSPHQGPINLMEEVGAAPLACLGSSPSSDLVSGVSDTLNPSTSEAAAATEADCHSSRAVHQSSIEQQQECLQVPGSLHVSALGHSTSRKPSRSMVCMLGVSGEMAKTGGGNAAITPSFSAEVLDILLAEEEKMVQIRSVEQYYLDQKIAQLRGDSPKLVRVPEDLSYVELKEKQFDSPVRFLGHTHVGHTIMKSYVEQQQKPFVSSDEDLARWAAQFSVQTIPEDSSLPEELHLGAFEGGDLQVGRHRLCAHHQWQQFDAHQPHRVLKYSGTRYAVALYVPKRAEMLQPSHFRELFQLGFPVHPRRAWPQSARLQHQLVELSSFPALPTIGEDEEAEEVHVPTTGEAAEEVEEPEQTDVPMEELSPEQQAAVRRAHVNLGHPRRSEFLRALRLARVRPGVRKWVKHCFSCPECEANRRPSLRRPAMLARSYSFNKVVGVDAIEVHVSNLVAEHYLNMVCWGTRLQLAGRMGSSTTAEAALKQFMLQWVHHFGYPELCVVDQGSEFKGMFAQSLEQAGVYVHVIDSRAPWQQGRTERAGGLLKQQLALAVEEHEVWRSLKS